VAQHEPLKRFKQHDGTRWTSQGKSMDNLQNSRGLVALVVGFCFVTPEVGLSLSPIYHSSTSRHLLLPYCFAKGRERGDRLYGMKCGSSTSGPCIPSVLLRKDNVYLFPSRITGG